MTDRRRQFKPNTLDGALARIEELERLVDGLIERVEEGTLPDPLVYRRTVTADNSRFGFEIVDRVSGDVIASG